MAADDSDGRASFLGGFPGIGIGATSCEARPLTTSEETAIDASSGVGMDAYAGIALRGSERCGWTFGGYALRLLEDVANENWWYYPPAAPCHGYAWAGGSLGYHVKTTSTSTVLIRDSPTSRSGYNCFWRMYFPSPILVSDVSGKQFTATESERAHNVNDVEGIGIEYPEHREGYADSDDWDASGKFDSRYLAFVDSPDGGRTFPVWGPRAYGASTINSASCWEGFSFDWEAAGWTSTALRTRNEGEDGPDSAGLYVRYQDVTVLDLREEIGYYVLICVECSSASAQAVGGDDEQDCCVGSCDGCPDPAPGGMPYTRLVAFFCWNAEFQAADIVPSPNSYDDALALLSPDSGAEPGSGDCPNEWYGVPHALITPSRDEVLIYVPWTGDATASDRDPLRVRRTYPEGDYSNADDPESPRWQQVPGGVSCFRLSVAQLKLLGDSAGTAIPKAFLNAVAGAEMSAGYQGELLITDGERNYQTGPDGSLWEYPMSVTGVTDPQFVYVGNDLWVYWDRVHEGGSDDSTDQLWRAKVATQAEIQEATELRHGGGSADYTEVLSRNGDDTLFLQPERCALEFDMRSLYNSGTYDEAGWGDYGKLVADPDIAELNDGKLRVSYFGGDPRGLMYAITTMRRDWSLVLGLGG